MNIDDPDLTPVGALPRPVLGPHRVPVATFTPTLTPHPDELWRPFTRTNDVTRDGFQGAPLSYQPGRSIEHEPLDQGEKDSARTTQRAYSFAETAGHIRSALRPGALG